MRADRGKPRVTHVRTGCLTCKRRRVKCPEERPACSRCIRAGFVCAGYAVPRTWLFEGSAGAQSKASNPLEQSSGQALHRNPSINAYPTPAASPGQVVHFSANHPLSSPLQAGNSDPFDSYAIPIGPRESYLIQFYRSDVIPHFYSLDHRAWMNVMAADDWYHCMNCLKDEAAAYSLLARNSALEHLITRGPGAPASTSVLDYLSRGQAALSRRLPLMNGSETPATVYPIMWATCFLAGTEMILQSPTSDVHFRALSNLIVRYVELMGEHLEEGSILNLVFADIARATMNPTRPMLDMLEWFPRLYQESWNTARPLLSRVYDAASAEVHTDVKDDAVRRQIMSTRETCVVYRNLRGANLEIHDAKLIATATHSQRLFRQGQLLHIAMDALESLKRPDLGDEQIQELSARAYIPLAILLWTQLVSTVSINLNVLFDSAPGILPHLKYAVMKSLGGKRTRAHEREPFVDAQLWALYVGTQTDCHRSEVLGLNKVCGEWFLETFRGHASFMRVQTWQHAVMIFQYFLHSDHLMPHISEWWQRDYRINMPIREVTSNLL